MQSDDEVGAGWIDLAAIPSMLALASISFALTGPDALSVGQAISVRDHLADLALAIKPGDEEKPT